MQKIYEKVNRWLLPAFVILFAVGMVTFSFAACYAYAGGSEAPGHVLTYTRAKLQWDSATGIDSNGAAVLKLFGSKKPGVAAGNVVAPGTSGGSIIRLNNNTTGERKWQPTPVFLPGESQGQGSLVGCPLWGRTESDTTEVT